jgi:hypothetical protein
MMTELWGADPTIKIFIYDTKTRSNDTSFLDSPRAFKDLNRENFTSYFFNGYPLYGGGMRNAQILMSHAKPFEEIRRNINHYLLRFNAGFFKKSLQCKVSTVLGWAYMTMEKMDRSLLAEKLSERMGIPVGIQWRMISTGVPTKAIKNEDKVRAIHFEVETKYSGYAKKALADIYDYKKLNNYPLGIRMRFVPDIARVTESKDKVKLSTLIGLQRSFQEKIGTHTNGEVRNVDAALPDGRTIREYLMALKVDEEEDKNMFVAINPDPLRGGTQFAFFPQFRDDATTTLLHLLVRLRSEFSHITKDKVDLLFNSTAIERADETLWNSETKKAFTMESECIASILEAAQTCDLMYTQLADKQDGRVPDTKTTKAEGDGDDSSKLLIGEVSTVVTTKTFSTEPESVLRKPRNQRTENPEVKSVSFTGKRYSSGSYGQDNQSTTSGITHDDLTENGRTQCSSMRNTPCATKANG